ncbi:unnamed protein product [Acanthoscelides obtectus]|uniref:Exonuclease domain-containing protein n=1 Tax=Acanthoscelides obtectus TaxID=200917 RepID=A0A9P0NU05_ACAOB|nr:unnamed protein product [Acanthoscelides obtectus]CAK1665714.1 Maternal protein exuperantia [Acanthoscelides obtectus]
MAMERAAVPVEDTKTSLVIPEENNIQPDCFVIVDLETSGFRAYAEIVQIAAKCGSEEFSAYMTPKYMIDPQASEVHGLQLDCKGRLVNMRTGDIVPTRSSNEVALEFLNFLRKCGKKVVLVGHNIVRFDGPRIVRFMENHCLVTEFCSLIHGMVDSLPLLRQGKVGRLSLLASTYLTGVEWQVHLENAHDALHDCILVAGLLDHFNVTPEIMLRCVYSIRDFMERQLYNARKNTYSFELMPLTQVGVSKNMIGQIAGAGVTMEELRELYIRSGKEGIAECLSVQVSGAPRVTAHKASINKITSFFESPVVENIDF